MSVCCFHASIGCLSFFIFLKITASWESAARATLEILIPDFVKQTSEEKPVEGDELEVGGLLGSRGTLNGDKGPYYMS